MMFQAYTTAGGDKKLLGEPFESHDADAALREAREAHSKVKGVYVEKATAATKAKKK